MVSVYVQIRTLSEQNTITYLVREKVGGRMTFCSLQKLPLSLLCSYTMCHLSRASYPTHKRHPLKSESLCCTCNTLQHYIFIIRKILYDDRIGTHPNSEEKNPLEEFNFLSASDSRAMAFSSLLDIIRWAAAE